MAERFFNLEEAEELLPALEALLNRAMKNKKIVEAVDEEIAGLRKQVMWMGGVLLDHDGLGRRKSQKDDSLSQLKAALEEIEAIGCLVKDLDMGLVDFPCLSNNREIYLCWKLGEPRIGFWHNVDEGFRGRKPLDQEFLKGIQGAAPN